MLAAQFGDHGGELAVYDGAQLVVVVTPALAAGADEKILIRVFCHAYGDKVVLLLAGYDKLAQPSKTRQGEQIKIARKRLAAWKLRQAKARARRRSP